ncbi:MULTISPECIES: hypothetical protein [unclassified Thalassospira]|uniref:hypothetical protein n=1 Tax=unclassified Thalassospira TaxID=2648997 RepID=UPI0025D5B607|nr:MULTISPECIES: hypothetical protein [unclassified Thalassospira]|tara:strand:- start:1395 stop:1568 length:174 start_codon:yes stop_codon:yes gene_type:complete
MPFVLIRRKSTSRVQAGKDSAYDRNYGTKEIWRQEFPDIEKVQLPDESELFEFFGFA